MSVFSELRSIYINGKEFSKDKYAINNLTSIMRNISSILILIVLILHYWGFMQYFNIPKIPLFEVRFREVLHKYTFMSLIVWIVFDFLTIPLFSKIIIRLETKCKARLLPLWNTIEDLLKISSAGLMMLFSVNILIEFSNGYNVLTRENQNVYGLIILYFILGIINWIYIKNSNRWYYLEKAYTDYFDVNGNRIAEDDMVIYYGKLYEIIYARKNDTVNSIDSKKNFG